MFKVSTDQEVLYRGWCQHEALDVLSGNPTSKLEVVDDVHVNSLDEADLFSQLRALGVESGDSLKNVVGEVMDKIGLTKESVEEFLSDVQNDGNQMVKFVKSRLDEGSTVIGEALTRLGTVIKRASEKTDTD